MVRDEWVLAVKYKLFKHYITYKQLGEAVGTSEDVIKQLMVAPNRYPNLKIKVSEYLNVHENL